LRFCIYGLLHFPLANKINAVLLVASGSSGI
jgi:hypothetical protein